MRLPDSPEDQTAPSITPPAGTSAVDPAAVPVEPGDERYARLEQMIPMLVDRLPQLLDEVRQLLTEEWPDYAQFLAQQRDEVAQAAESFMRWLLHIAGHGLTHLPQDSIPEFGAQTELFEEIGRVQWRGVGRVVGPVAASPRAAPAAGFGLAYPDLSALHAPPCFAALTAPP